MKTTKKDNNTSIATAGNHTRATQGAQAVLDALDTRMMWQGGRDRKSGFLADHRPTPEPNTIIAPITVTDGSYSDKGDALSQVLDIIGDKPERLSWRDFGRIVAAAYAVGGRDAAYLDRIIRRANWENFFGGRTEDDLFWLLSAIDDDPALARDLWARADAKRKSFDE